MPGPARRRRTVLTNRPGWLLATVHVLLALPHVMLGSLWSNPRLSGRLPSYRRRLRHPPLTVRGIPFGGSRSRRINSSFIAQSPLHKRVYDAALGTVPYCAVRKKTAKQKSLETGFPDRGLDTLPTPACEPLQERTAVVGLPKVISGPLDSAVVCATP